MRLLATVALGFPALAGGITSTVLAAGVERTLPSTTRILFEEGNYLEAGISYSDPHQQGRAATLPPPFVPFPVTAPFLVEGETPDLFEPLWSISGAFKNDINDRLSYALILDQPFGANTSYGSDVFGGGFFSYAGTNAELDAQQIAGLVAYDIRPDLKLYGGLRALRTTASADVPFLFDYTVDTNADWGMGYVVGGAWSRPDFAMRFSLTYSSHIRIRYDTEERGSFDSTTEVDFPRTVDLEFQTGIAPGTLLFGSVRWAEWSEFEMAPELYTRQFMEPLVRYDEDYITYTLGIGRQLTNRLAGSIGFVYEPSQGGSNLNTLGPYDGRTLGTAALSYDLDRFNITGGMVYGSLGDTSNGFDTSFDNGSVWGAGLRVGYTF